MKSYSIYYLSPSGLRDVSALTGQISDCLHPSFELAEKHIDTLPNFQTYLIIPTYIKTAFNEQKPASTL